MKQKSTRKRFGSYVTLLTVIVIAATILLNTVVTLLTDRFNLQLDLTPTAAYSLTEEGEEIVNSINEAIQIYVLADESDFVNGGGGSLDPYFSQANTMIKLIAASNPLFELDYIDLDKNPSFRSGYPDYTLHTNDVLVECGEKVVHIQSIDLFNTTLTTMGTTTITSSKAEEAVLSAMKVVTAEHLPRVTVLQGYEEFSCDPLGNLLITNAYEMNTLNIATADAIPADTEMVIVCSPKRDYSNDDLDKLEAFLYNDGSYGKTLLYFADTEQPPLPNLEGFLSEWGIDVLRGTVFETNTSRIISSNVFYALNNFTQNDFTAEVSERTLFPTLPYCRPLEAAYAESGIRKVSKLIEFTTQSGIYPEGESGWQPTEDDIIGDVPGMMISQAKPTASDVYPSSVVVCGSVNFINEDLLKEPTFANAEFLVSLTNKLVKPGDTLELTSKRIGNGYLSINTSEQQILFAVFVVILPLALAVAGIVVYLRRRHL